MSSSETSIATQNPTASGVLSESTNEELQRKDLLKQFRSIITCLCAVSGLNHGSMQQFLGGPDNASGGPDADPAKFVDDSDSPSGTSESGNHDLRQRLLNAMAAICVRHGEIVAVSAHNSLGTQLALLKQEAGSTDTGGKDSKKKPKTTGSTEDDAARFFATKNPAKDSADPAPVQLKTLTGSSVWDKIACAEEAKVWHEILRSTMVSVVRLVVNKMGVDLHNFVTGIPWRIMLRQFLTS